MSEFEIEKAIKNASASVEMEGFLVDEQSKIWCRKLLLNEITMEQYISLVKKSRSERIMIYSIDASLTVAMMTQLA